MQYDISRDQVMRRSLPEFYSPPLVEKSGVAPLGIGREKLACPASRVLS